MLEPPYSERGGDRQPPSSLTPGSYFGTVRGAAASRQQSLALLVLAALAAVVGIRC